MPRVIGALIAQTIEILLALTSSLHIVKETTRDPDLLRKVYTALWSKLGDGRALNDGQVVYLGASYDLMSLDGCRWMPPRGTIGRIRACGVAAASMGRVPRRRRVRVEAGMVCAAARGKKDLQKKSETRQDVYDLLTSLDQS